MAARRRRCASRAGAATEVVGVGNSGRASLDAHSCSVAPASKLAGDPDGRMNGAPVFLWVVHRCRAGKPQVLRLRLSRLREASLRMTISFVQMFSRARRGEVCEGVSWASVKYRGLSASVEMTCFGKGGRISPGSGPGAGKC
jgi:hypothetical protein